jgi:uncharacterized protein (DUF302 family)
LKENKLGFSVQIEGPFDSVIERVLALLKEEGFGLLTEIDVQATMKQKLNADFRPYRILGVCNPHLAHRALSLAPHIGLLMPCNVVADAIDANLTEISFSDPMLMASMGEVPELEEVAREARQRLEKVAKILEHG